PNAFGRGDAHGNARWGSHRMGARDGAAPRHRRLSEEHEGEFRMTDIRFLGQSCFEITDGATRVLIDPFLKPNNPIATVTAVAIGQAAGWVVNVGGTTFYHLGDTCLFGDMKLIAERTPVDVALVPIGGHYTMDRHDAVVAVDLIAPKVVIPMHYNTFPPIETD